MGISISTSPSPLRFAPRSNACALAIALFSLVAPLAGCGDDTGDGAGGSGTGNGTGSGTGSGDAACGTVDNPTLLTLTNVSPPDGSVVGGDSVVHAFTIVGAPGLIQTLNFQTGATHTAGTPVPESLSFAVTQDGGDLTYTAEPVRWDTTAHVELSVVGAFQVEGGCVFAFPAPLFDYDVEATEGSGGGGAGGGSGGGAGEGGEAPAP